MYIRYADLKKCEVEILDVDTGSATLKITGKNAWKYFEGEKGKHCIQRVPPTEIKGRKQTSYVVVGVLPIKEKLDENPIPYSEIDIKCQTGHGKGGQHQNKTASAVRMVHRPTKLSVFINGREQLANKKLAYKILNMKVLDYYKENSDKGYEQERKDQLSDSRRGGKVRTYNFMKSRITDHNTGKETAKVKQFMKGDLDLVK